MNYLKRFEDKFEKTEGCWNWEGVLSTNGYGVFRLDSKLARASRVAYSIYVDEIPENKQVFHNCFNRKCVNPAHLQLDIITETHRQKLSDAKQDNTNAEKPGKTVITHSISFYSPHLEIAARMIKAGEGINLSQAVRKALEWAEDRL